MSWNRIRTVIRGAQAAIESEPKHLAPLRPIVEEALLLLSKPPTKESRDEVRFLLSKIQEFVIQWRPSPRPTPGVFYIQPNWAKSTDSQVTDALALLDTLPPDTTVTGEPEPMRKETTMKVFVSHSSVDKSVAEAFVELVRAALNLSSKDIRCTSVAGYKLPAGAVSDEQLRTEVFGCELFIALLSPTSMKSVYVMFELGARWGTKRYLAPIMVSGTQPSDLKAPISGIHSIDGTAESDLHQLLAEMGAELSLPLEGAASYNKALRAFVKAAKKVTKSQKDNLPTKIQEYEQPTKRSSHVNLLDEIKVKILVALSKQEQTITEHLASILNIGVETSRFHLRELSKKNMVIDNIAPDDDGSFRECWELEHEGRRFLVENNLIS